MNGRGEGEKGGNKGDMNHLLVLSLLTHFSEWGDKKEKSFAASTTAGERGSGRPLACS